MQRIALLSDTHNYLETKMLKYFDSCDQIWHAGDIGTISITDQLAKIKPLIAVYGNIDGTDVRTVHPKNQIFLCEQVKVFMTHIGGYPNRYSLDALEEIKREAPQLFICGHSHILKVMFDQKYKLLHINPGAAGVHGFHKVKTMVRFTIDGNKIKDLEVIELGVRA
jgi:putative phosphoesterase